MGSSMKDIKLRIKSVESTMQITKAMELVASSKMRRAKERVEHSRPYFETLYETLTKIAAMDPRAQQGYLPRKGGNGRTLLVVIAGDRGLAGGYNANVFKLAEEQGENPLVLPIGKRSAEYFAHPRGRPVLARRAARRRRDGGGLLPAVPCHHQGLFGWQVRRGEDLLHPV